MLLQSIKISAGSVRTPFLMSAMQFTSRTPKIVKMEEQVGGFSPCQGKEWGI